MTSNLLKSIYYDPNHSAGFSSIKKLYDAVKGNGVSYNEVKNWLQGENTYTLHKPVRKKFPRIKTVTDGINHQWQGDLVDLKMFSRFNSGYKYILTLIDVFSRKAWAIPVKSKLGKDIKKALQTVFSQNKPQILQTDKGREFINDTVQEYLKDEGVYFFTSQNDDIKCAIVERFNRTLKGKMFKYFTSKGTKRYINVLQDLVNSYNNSKHRSIKMTPNEVTNINTSNVFVNQYGFLSRREMLKRKFKNPKLFPGTSVRIPYKTDITQKGYLPNWTDEVFKVDKSIKGPMYRLRDSSNQIIEGRFYPYEVQQINSDPEYRIEKVIKSRIRDGRKEYFVKWLNFPAKFNSWITHLRELK